MKPTVNATVNAQGQRLVFPDSLGDDLTIRLRGFLRQYWKDSAEAPSQIVLLAGTTIAAALHVAPRARVLPWTFSRQTGALYIEGLGCPVVVCEDPTLRDLEYRVLTSAQSGVVGRPTSVTGTLTYY